MTRPIDIKEFAERVERMCDFFLTQKIEETGRYEGDNDVSVLEQLKDDAADIQCFPAQIVSTAISGLDAYMKGHPVPKKAGDKES